MSATSSDAELPYCMLYDVSSGSDADFDDGSETQHSFHNDYYIPRDDPETPILVCAPSKTGGGGPMTIRWDDLSDKGEWMMFNILPESLVFL